MKRLRGTRRAGRARCREDRGPLPNGQVPVRQKLGKSRRVAVVQFLRVDAKLTEMPQSMALLRLETALEQATEIVRGVAAR